MGAERAVRLVTPLIGLVACNSVFGIEHTKLQKDYFDAKPDAPFACPTDTETAPAFSQFFVQVVAVDDCRSYTIGGDKALATCTQQVGDLAVEAIEQGPANAPLDTTVHLSPMPAGSMSAPVLSPDGSELWLSSYDTNTNTTTIGVYSESSSGNWEHQQDVYSTPAFFEVGTPMQAGSNRRVLVLELGTVHELAENPPGTWTDIHTYNTSTDLQLGAIYTPPNITPDGLHAVLPAASSGLGMNQGVFYLARSDLSQPFGPAISVPGPPPNVQTPFMTGDCSRVYFSGLDSVLYVPTL